MHPVTESATDDEDLAALAGVGRARAILLRLPCRGLIVLRHRLEHGKEVAALGGDLPTIAVTQHEVIAKNVDRRHARGKPPDPRAPFRAAGSEDGNVPIEGG